MKEADIMRLVQMRVTSLGHRVFRNNVGMAWDRRGVPIHFGLGVGSGDLVGLTKSGRFLSIEVKTSKGRVSDEQLAWMSMVKSMGGLAFIIREPSEVDVLLANE